jgi:outer membrane protein insertion porin family
MKTKHRISALAAALLLAFQAHASESFQVSDIRVEGIQRTEAGTVFSYLPIKVGETLTPDRASAAIEALYATGFFKDVRLEVQDSVLIVMVEERPAIASVDFTGMKEFQKDEIKNALKQLGLAEGRILDKSLLDKAEQELKRQYYNRGLYAVQVAARLSPLERNRTAITFEVNEGEVAKIRSINIVGAKAFKEKALLKLFTLSTPGMMSWWTKNDQYSKQKLAGDLEALRSHYLNKGYLEFRIESTQVSITPDKKDIYITLNINEGDVYTVADYKIVGELPVPEEELRALVTLKPGDVFSREALNDSIKKIGDRLGNDGYAFSNVNAAPEVDKDKKLVNFSFLVDPGRKVYVRRINIAGNTVTRDEVIRREMRQFEGGAYAADKINRSRSRVDRLSYFKDVSIETPPVPGTPDQVDLNVNVTEQSTGSIMLGAGFSSSDGLVISGSVSQRNLFGSGNALSLQMNTGSYNTVYSLSYTQPYFTPDGTSIGYDIYHKEVDTSDLDDVNDYKQTTIGGGVRLGVPVTEFDTINLSAVVENLEFELNPDSSDNYKRFCDSSYDPTLDYGKSYDCDKLNVRIGAGWSRDSRDSVLWPTKGSYQKANLELGTPLGDVKYYRLSYEHQWFWPLSRDFTVMLNGEIGYGDGYDDEPMPFFRNFYAGGIGSVRGFKAGTIGPKDSDDDAIGGDTRFVGNAELLFPFPGSGNDRSLRLSAFVDAGAVWGPYGVNGDYEDIDFSDLRYSAGLAVIWMSPMGPIRLSLATPLRDFEGDETEVFQFQMGNVF